jgi:hypothetical protein
MSGAGSSEIGLKERNGPGEGSDLLAGQGQIFLRGVIVGVGAQGAIQLIDGGRKLAEADEDGSERAVALLGGGIETDDLVEHLLGGTEVAVTEVAETGAIVGVGLPQGAGLSKEKDRREEDGGRKRGENEAGDAARSKNACGEDT